MEEAIQSLVSVHSLKNTKTEQYFLLLWLNRCLPLNFRAEDLASGILRERVKVGASLADVDPMIVDKSVRSVKTSFSFPQLCISRIHRSFSLELKLIHYILIVLF